MRRIDLHTHSTASDGSLSPTALVTAAARIGLDVIALTDHDTCDGLDEALVAADRLAVEVIPGLELSIDHDKGSLHLLGYGLDHRDPRLAAVLAELVESRRERNIKIVERLNGLGFRITFEDMMRRSPSGTMGRAHIALELAESRQVGTFDEAFERLLKRGAAAYFERRRLRLAEACDLIHLTGGAAVWAHPMHHGAELPALLQRLPDWGKAGLDGIESDYSSHTLKQRDFLRREATRNGMIYTGGSDFHGAARPAIKLGDGPAGGGVAEECLEGLRKRIEKVQASGR